MKHVHALLVLLLAGCGAPGGRDTVRIALVANVPSHLPVVLASKLGFYREEGVEVMIEPLPNAQKTAEALLAGSADLATGGYNQLLQMVASGRQVRSIVVNTIRDARVIVASPVRKDIRSLEDCKGRNFGVPGLGSANHLFALHVFALHGLGSEDASFAGVGVGAPMMAALERGVVDAAVVEGTDLIRLRRRNSGIVVLADAASPAGTRAIWPVETVPNAIVFALEGWIGANRGKVMRVVRADRRALAWIESHSAAELLAVMPEYRTDESEDDLEAFRLMKRLYSPDGLMPRAGAEAVRAALARTQATVRNAQIDLSSTYTDEFAATIH